MMTIGEIKRRIVTLSATDALSLVAMRNGRGVRLSEMDSRRFVDLELIAPVGSTGDLWALTGRASAAMDELINERNGTDGQD